MFEEILSSCGIKGHWPHFGDQIAFYSPQTKRSAVEIHFFIDAKRDASFRASTGRVPDRPDNRAIRYAPGVISPRPGHFLYFRCRAYRAGSASFASFLRPNAAGKRLKTSTIQPAVPSHVHGMRRYRSLDAH